MCSNARPSRPIRSRRAGLRHVPRTMRRSACRGRGPPPESAPALPSPAPVREAQHRANRPAHPECPAAWGARLRCAAPPHAARSAKPPFLRRDRWRSWLPPPRSEPDPASLPRSPAPPLRSAPRPRVPACKPPLPSRARARPRPRAKLSSFPSSPLFARPAQNLRFQCPNSTDAARLEAALPRFAPVVAVGGAVDRCLPPEQAERELPLALA